jgi:hypothetical protein
MVVKFLSFYYNYFICLKCKFFISCLGVYLLEMIRINGLLITSMVRVNGVLIAGVFLMVMISYALNILSCHNKLKTMNLELYARLAGLICKILIS